MSIWLVVIIIQFLLLFAWWRAAKMWMLLNKADIFLRKSKLFLKQHKFEDEATTIKDEQMPKYREWKVENFAIIILIYLMFTVLPVVGVAISEGREVTMLTTGVTILLASIGYLWNLTKIRVDILNIECDIIDNLVNIIKSDQTALQTDKV